MDYWKEVRRRVLTRFDLWGLNSQGTSLLIAMVLAAATWAWSGEFDWKAVVVMVFAYGLVMGVLYLREMAKEPPIIDQEKSREIYGLKEKVVAIEAEHARDLDERESDDELEVRKLQHQADSEKLKQIEDCHERDKGRRRLREHYFSEKEGIRNIARNYVKLKKEQNNWDFDEEEVWMLRDQGGPRRNTK